jgi:hypothetical protein
MAIACQWFALLAPGVRQLLKGSGPDMNGAGVALAGFSSLLVGGIVGGLLLWPHGARYVPLGVFLGGPAAIATLAMLLLRPRFWPTLLSTAILVFLAFMLTRRRVARMALDGCESGVGDPAGGRPAPPDA